MNEADRRYFHPHASLLYPDTLVLHLDRLKSIPIGGQEFLGETANESKFILIHVKIIITATTFQVTTNIFVQTQNIPFCLLTWLQEMHFLHPYFRWIEFDPAMSLKLGRETREIETLLLVESTGLCMLDSEIYIKLYNIGINNEKCYFIISGVLQKKRTTCSQ